MGRKMNVALTELNDRVRYAGSRLGLRVTAFRDFDGVYFVTIAGVDDDVDNVEVLRFDDIEPIYAAVMGRLREYDDVRAARIATALKGR